MKVRIEQLNPIIGDLKGNTSLILDALKLAERAGIDLLILPEMVVTGYPAQDLLESEAFRDSCYRANDEIISASAKTAVLFGSVTPKKEGFGRKMYNSALLAKEGEMIGMTHKALLPTYDIFDDLRYFEPNKSFKCLNLDGVKLGVTICEDIWYNENEVQYHTYEVDPAAELKKAGADVIINISASPYTNTKHQNRVSMLKNHARKLDLPVFYANQVGAHTDIIFDGDSMVINRNTDIVTNTRIFHPSFTDIEWNPDSGKVTGLTELQIYPSSKQERQFEAVRCGLRDYIDKLNITENVVLGLSGGVDSALVCALAVETLGADRVKAITLPGQFSSKGSVTDSRLLADNLGVELFELSIEPLFEEFRNTLAPLFKGESFGVAEENVQSRIRGSLLMAYSNKFGNFLLPTGNKSEYAVGYATLYGDMNGALAIIGDLYKTEVYDLCKWLNSSYYKKEVIPDSILVKPPSAELRPDQKDTDSLPDYEVLDDILYRYIELQQSRSEISESGYESELVHKILRMVDMSEFKRYQAAPILKLASKSFGTGRRWPIVQKWK
ncbi:MAG: NAD+ synthase [Balneolaceae bacterium]|nr:MAG: NAD+ synthase [Balneolaceae bacterium]